MYKNVTSAIVLSIVIGCTEILVFCHQKQQFWHLNKVVTVIAAGFMRDLQAKNNKVMGRSWQSRLCWFKAQNIQSQHYIEEQCLGVIWKCAIGNLFVNLRLKVKCYVDRFHMF